VRLKVVFIAGHAGPIIAISNAPIKTPKNSIIKI